MHWTSQRTYSVLHQWRSASGRLWKCSWVASCDDYAWAFHLVPLAHWGPLSSLINLFPDNPFHPHSWGSQGLSWTFESLSLAFFYPAVMSQISSSAYASLHWHWRGFERENYLFLMENKGRPLFKSCRTIVRGGQWRKLNSDHPVDQPVV